jgi:mannose-6-phosphate isomerase
MHVDVPELLRILHFRETRVEALSLEGGAGGEGHCQTPAEEFRLSRFDIAPGSPFASCIVPACAGCYRVEGAGALYRASVPG